MSPHPGTRLAPVEALAALTDDRLAALRTALARASFGDQVADEAESLLPGTFDAVRQPAVEWRLRRVGSPAALATLLFLYSGRLSRAALDGLLGPDLVEALLAAAVLEERAEGLASRYRLTPLQGLLFLHDPFEGGPETTMGPGATTLVLARLIPASAGAVLDVGCGAGTLALLAAARGARRAVGVDLSPRAVALARVNARLNALPAEFRAGDLLEPVRGERFDLVLSQPPYVPAPPGLATTTYLHGGPVGDELAHRFAAAFPAALAEGGLAAIFFDAPRGAEAPLRRLRRVLGDARVSLGLLRAPAPPNAITATAFATVEDPTLGPAYRDAVERYSGHLAQVAPRGIARMLALLQRPRPGEAGFDAELQIAHFDGADTTSVGRWLRGLAALAGSEEALRALPVRPAPSARLVLSAVPGSGEEPRRALRFSERGLAGEFDLSEAGAALVEILAASGSVAEAEQRFAEAAEEPVERVRATVLGFVRDGLSRGVLAVASP